MFVRNLQRRRTRRRFRRINEDNIKMGLQEVVCGFGPDSLGSG
jgi:hypothetical protein